MLLFAGNRVFMWKSLLLILDPDCCWLTPLALAAHSKPNKPCRAENTEKWCHCLFSKILWLLLPFHRRRAVAALANELAGAPSLRTYQAGRRRHYYMRTYGTCHNAFSPHAALLMKTLYTEWHSLGTASPVPSCQPVGAGIRKQHTRGTHEHGHRHRGSI